MSLQFMYLWSTEASHHVHITCLGRDDQSLNMIFSKHWLSVFVPKRNLIKLKTEAEEM